MKLMNQAYNLLRFESQDIMQTYILRQDLCVSECIISSLKTQEESAHEQCCDLITFLNHCNTLRSNKYNYINDITHS